jgi:hypothetical protein
MNKLREYMMKINPVLFAIAITVSGCIPSVEHQQDRTQKRNVEYLQQLKSVPLLRVFPDKVLLEQGYLHCKNLDNGETVKDIIWASSQEAANSVSRDGVSKDSAIVWNRLQTATVTHAAIILCPKHKSQVIEYMEDIKQMNSSS